MACTAVVAVLMSTSAAIADEPMVPAPQGSPLLLEVTADGVQVYICEAKGNSFEWSFKGPEANLFDNQGRQVGTHFAGPTWKLADGSEVVAETVGKSDAPEPGAIQWLLLRAKAHQGSGLLSRVAFIRRADTRGGAAPSTGCDVGHLRQEARMRYSATYQFFGAAGGG